MLSKIKKEIEDIRSMGATVSDLQIDGVIASYVVSPGTDTGYIQEINIVTGECRNCGLGRGCFWTEWK
jgi:hypothetical protein